MMRLPLGRIYGKSPESYVLQIMKKTQRYIKQKAKILSLAAILATGVALSACTHCESHAANVDVPLLQQEEETTIPVEAEPARPAKPVAQKILFLGDSMTGWMAERLNAYGDENGFEVATVVWDGSTLPKWGNSDSLKELIEEQKPDAIMVSLGMNDMFETNPEARFGDDLSAILNAFGEIPYLWVGPPTWPGHQQGEVFNSWLEERLGHGNFFRSDSLTLPRQSSSNPHPTRGGIEKWIDLVVEWIPENANFSLPGTQDPGDGKMTRGKTFIYKRMKEKL